MLGISFIGHYKIIINKGNNKFVAEHLLICLSQFFIITVILLQKSLDFMLHLIL